MISTYVVQANPTISEPVKIMVPVGAEPLWFSMEQGPGQISFLADSESLEVEERTVLFAQDGVPGVMTPAHSVDSISLQNFFFLGSSRGWHCWVL